jgi:hypothetical protein
MFYLLGAQIFDVLGKAAVVLERDARFLLG